MNAFAKEKQSNHSFGRNFVQASFWGVLGITILLGAGFALRTPPWQAPDEPAHYNYIVQVAANGCCPVIEPGDWDSDYLSSLTSGRFAPDLLGSLESVQYEDHQPPLYYLLGALIFRLTDGSLVALRLFSVLLGAGVVACAWRVGRRVAPEQPQIALGAALLVGFIPQHMAMLASVNNDALAELTVGLTLLAALRHVQGQGGRWSALIMGLLVGVGLLTKLSTLFLLAVGAAAILIRWWNRRSDAEARQALPLREMFLFFAPALILGAVWWGRNISVYGFPDVFGLRAHDSVVVGQLRTAELISDVGMGEYLRRALETTFQSFWGQFGWMALPLPGWTYTLLIGLCALVVSGWGIGLLGRLKPLPEFREGHKNQWGVWALLALTVVLAVAQYVYYNTSFVQFQGRYMYPLLIPLGVWAALGLDAWGRLADRFIGRAEARPYMSLLALLPLALLIPLNVYLLWRVIPLLNP